MDRGAQSQTTKSGAFPPLAQAQGGAACRVVMLGSMAVDMGGV
jgi:hypothetical protein